jgi:hypothetical protein
MKMLPELEAIPMSHDPCHADSREVLPTPTLQLYQAGCSAEDRRHDHILCAALLANGLTTREPYKQ